MIGISHDRLIARSPCGLQQVAHVFKEYAQMGERMGHDETLVHIGLPHQFLHIAIGAHRYEAFATAVVAIPEVLHDPKNPEHDAVNAGPILGQCGGVKAGQ
jgi:hypothetical protein